MDPNQLSQEKPSEADPDFDELEDAESDADEDPNVFRVRQPLEMPSAKIYTTQKLHSLIHEGVIDLEPDYQRAVVWPVTKQMNLIKSIFENYYIPPIIFAVRTDDEGEEIRVCVDGKQRLTSIQLFFDGQLAYRDAKTKKSFYYTRSETHDNRLDIPEYWKKQFAEKLVTCVEYYDLSPGTEREIFQRVQLGMPLTAAEKLQAIDSPWAQWISDLEAQHVAAEDGLAQALSWDTKRGRDFQCIAHFVYCCDGIPEEQIPTAQKMEKWLVRVDAPVTSFKSDIHDALTEFWNIATTPELNIGFKKIDKRIAPVEFVFIGVLLYVLRKEPRETRAKAIYHLRKSIRSQFDDVRFNTKVGKALWAIVHDLTTNPSSASYNFHSANVLENGDAKKNRKKRKTGPTESDEEYRPTPINALGKAPKTRAKQQKTG